MYVLHNVDPADISNMRIYMYLDSPTCVTLLGDHVDVRLNRDILFSSEAAQGAL